MIKVYRGYLQFQSDGVGVDILHLSANGTPLAEMIQDHISRYGSYLTVRYFIGPTKKNLKSLKDILIKQLLGIGEAEYSHAYSEYTGYLWTDETIKIGGHDLLEELSSHLGSYLYLAIEYNEKPNHEKY